MKPANIRNSLSGLLLLCAMAVSLAGCAAPRTADTHTQAIDAQADESQTSGLTGDPAHGSTPAKKPEETFVSSQMRFAVSLFRQAAATGEGNVLLSPLSVQLALAMTANGAGGQTLAEMEALLGGSVPLEELNEQLRTYVGGLPSGEGSALHIANSVWYREDDGLTVSPDFVQCVTDAYDAQVFGAAFDDQTAKDINNWVSQRTDGMIDNMVDRIPDVAMIYLINALAFDAEWQTPYQESDVRDGSFTSASGERQDVQMMHSTEGRYFDTDNAVGFFKSYKGGGYSFVGILPDEGVSLHDYIAGLDTAALLQAMQNASYGSAKISMPKFSYDYALTLNDCLIALGIPTAFDKDAADFSRLCQSAAGNCFISKVQHKTHIEVGELGTRAGAATKVEIAPEGAPPMSGPTIRLDRPFLYMIVDNATNLPLLIGTVTSI